jgi:hypothetical protein
VYVSFIFGLSVGAVIGVVLCYWWIRPDIKELRTQLEASKQVTHTLVQYALRNVDVKVVRKVIDGIDVTEHDA